MLLLTHSARLPYCYYDKYRSKIIIKLVSYESQVKAVNIIYGDPFNYVKCDDISAIPAKTEYKWVYNETPMKKQFTNSKETMWYVELDLPKWKRIKYGFYLETARSGKQYFSFNGAQPFNEEAIHIPHNHFSFPFIHEEDAPNIPAWAAETVWYQIFPERFYNGDPSISPDNTENWDTGEPTSGNFFGGDIPGIISKLPYLKELGINGIYINPVFLSKSNHKYNIEDYFLIDPHFGMLSDMKQLVKEAHALNIKVMLDVVFNHIGSCHPFWRDVLKHQEKSVYKDYFHIHSFPVETDSENYDTFAFTPQMPKWNTACPGAKKYLLDAATYWIKECDIDGWRLDVADEVSFDFWCSFSEKVRKTKKDFYVVGENWFDPSSWIQGGYFDAVMNYSIGSAIAEMFVKKRIDGRQFTEKLFHILMGQSDLHNQVSFNLLDSHDTARILSCAQLDKLAVKNAFLLLFMLPGSPSIYYGTEVGITGGSDPECRKPMIWNPEKQDADLLSYFKKLIAFRKENALFLRNAQIIYSMENFADVWRFENEGCIMQFVYNNSTQPIPYYPYKNSSILISTAELTSDRIIQPKSAVVWHTDERNHSSFASI